MSTDLLLQEVYYLANTQHFYTKFQNKLSQIIDTFRKGINAFLPSGSRSPSAAPDWAKHSLLCSNYATCSYA
jgi:hypothetical protein